MRIRRPERAETIAGGASGAGTTGTALDPEGPLVGSYCISVLAHYGVHSNRKKIIL